MGNNALRRDVVLSYFVFQIHMFVMSYRFPVRQLFDGLRQLATLIYFIFNSVKLGTIFSN